MRDNHFHVPLEFIERLWVVAQLLLLCFIILIIKVEVTGCYLIISYDTYSARQNQVLLHGFCDCIFIAFHATYV